MMSSLRIHGLFNPVSLYNQRRASLNPPDKLESYFIGIRRSMESNPPRMEIRRDARESTDALIQMRERDPIPGRLGGAPKEGMTSQRRGISIWIDLGVGHNEYAEGNLKPWPLGSEILVAGNIPPQFPHLQSNVRARVFFIDFGVMRRLLSLVQSGASLEGGARERSPEELVAQAFEDAILHDNDSVCEFLAGLPEIDGTVGANGVLKAKSAIRGEVASLPTETSIVVAFDRSSLAEESLEQ